VPLAPELRDAPGEQPQANRHVREDDRDCAHDGAAEQEAAQAGGDDERPSHTKPIG